MAKTIEIKMCNERHRLVKLPEELVNGCGRCSIANVCLTMGNTANKNLCDALIKLSFDYPKEHFPNGGFFQKKMT